MKIKKLNVDQNVKNKNLYNERVPIILLYSTNIFFVC